MTPSFPPHTHLRYFGFIMSLQCIIFEATDILRSFRPTSPSMCMAWKWLFVMELSLRIGSLIAKSIRIWKIFVRLILREDAYVCYEYPPPHTHTHMRCSMFNVGLTVMYDIGGCTRYVHFCLPRRKLNSQAMHSEKVVPQSVVPVGTTPKNIAKPCPNNHYVLNEKH